MTDDYPIQEDIFAFALSLKGGWWGDCGDWFAVIPLEG